MSSSDGTEPSTEWATGYRVCLLPGGLEVSARLKTADELRNLVNLLRAGTVFLHAANVDMDKPLTLFKRAAALRE